MHVGDIKFTARSTAPAGWLMCYGQAVSRTTYALLFTAIGTTYGTGDGSTTFNVPDLRGRVAAGKDDMGGSAASRLTSTHFGTSAAALGAVGGSESHTLTSAQIPAHSHPVGDAGGGTGSASGGGKFFAGTGASTNTANSTGGGNAHPNVQPTMVLNALIFAGV